MTTYLDERLTFHDGKIVDEDGGCVMMDWETEWMQRSAEIVCGKGGDILNIGFGLGIIDTFIQSYTPKSHTIIEAHPDIYAKMIQDGWADKPNVKIIHSRWQDASSLLSQYDGIYFDTYRDNGFKDLLLPLIKRILKPKGIFSYWEGRYMDRVDPDVVDSIAEDFDYSYEILRLPNVPNSTEQATDGNGYFNDKWRQCVIPKITFKAPQSKKELL